MVWQQNEKEKPTKPVRIMGLVDAIVQVYAYHPHTNFHELINSEHYTYIYIYIYMCVCVYRCGYIYRCICTYVCVLYRKCLSASDSFLLRK